MPPRVLIRNPYPIPDVSSEGFWIPPGPVLGNKVSIKDRNWTSRVDTHERLFAHQTLNSVRRNHRFIKTKAPDDALDFALTSTYVHSQDTFVPKMYVSMQPESLARETWRVLRNELKLSPEESEVSGFGKADGYGEVKRRNSKDTRDTKDSKEGKISDQKRLFAATPTRAATAPVRSVHNAPAGLHKYAGRTKHKGLPDRMERIHPSSLKLAIVGPHTDRTNPGFSRKDDGTFYSV